MLRGCFLPLTNNGSDRMTIKSAAKFCSVAAIILVVVAALGPAGWAPRTGLGWETDHFLGWFAITSLVCFAWPRPFVVGGAIMAFAALLEGLQAFTPDRSANLLAAVAAQAGRWRRLCLLSSSSGHGGGVPASRLFGELMRASLRGRLRRRDPVPPPFSSMNRRIASPAIEITDEFGFVLPKLSLYALRLCFYFGHVQRYSRSALCIESMAARAACGFWARACPRTPTVTFNS